LFDAGACGAMIITDEVPGLDAVFGDKITVYREAKNLPIKVKECLQQKGENVGKRLELVRLIGENHSFEKRSGEIVTVIERLNEVNMSARARD
jgi:spore maturation protein CgeB